ncbi:hypothetical protein V6N12_005259 [Hibiscus sabdariffa]|uniref:Uncharacterized protein n=1 Tax=Hibiscus sabdariffa TaxID=183260 RepID=A0ABR2CNY2_9ROSI
MLIMSVPSKPRKTFAGLSVRYSFYKVLGKEDAKRPVGFGRHTMADRDIATNLTRFYRLYISVIFVD